MVAQNGWHFALGKPGDKDDDGWVGFGGRQGANWLKFRLDKVGYLHWPTRNWQDIGGSPTYDRGKLTQHTNTMTIGPEGAESSVNTTGYAEWTDLWQTPGGGATSVQWRVDGEKLKEDITINQAAREWITENRPPDTTPSETYFGFVYELDISDIPKWVKNGVLQDIDTDFDDDDGATKIELRDAMDRLLAFLPVSYAYSQEDENGHRERITLRKRFWNEGGKNYLLVGARVDEVNSLPSGDLVFDPDISASAGDGDSVHARHYYSDLTMSRNFTVWGSYGGIGCEGGLRFFVNVPQGADITEAYLRVRAYSDKTGTGTMNIKGEASDNSDAFSTFSNFTGRARTTANVDWYLSSSWTAGSWYNSTDISGIISAITGREGWVSGNALTLFIPTAYDQNPTRYVSTYEESSSYTPELHITYSTGTAPTNDSLTFTNPYGGSGNDAVADDTTEWNFRAVVSDTDGYDDLDTVVLRLANSSDNNTPYDALKFTWTESTDTFAERNG